MDFFGSNIREMMFYSHAMHADKILPAYTVKAGKQLGSVKPLAFFYSVFNIHIKSVGSELA